MHSSIVFTYFDQEINWIRIFLPTPIQTHTHTLAHTNAHKHPYDSYTGFCICQKKDWKDTL